MYVELAYQSQQAYGWSIETFAGILRTDRLAISMQWPTLIRFFVPMNPHVHGNKRRLASDTVRAPKVDLADHHMSRASLQVILEQAGEGDAILIAQSGSIYEARLQACIIACFTTRALL